MSEPCQYETVNDIIAERDRLHAECDALRDALHQISLCSQNSMSSKEECGRIARAVLKEAK